MGIRFFSAKICKKNISSQSEKKQGNKKEKHTYTQLHQYSRFSLSKKGVWPVFVATPLKKSFSSKTKHAENIIEHNQQNYLSFQMAVPRPARSFFSLNSRISLAQNLAFRLPAMTNGLLLSVKADF